MDPSKIINFSNQKNIINNALNNIYNLCNHQPPSYPPYCEESNHSERVRLSNRVHSLEISEKTHIQTNLDLEKKILDYETTIHSLQDKLNLFNEEKQENNKTDTLHILGKEILLKDKEIEHLNQENKRLNNLIHNKQPQLNNPIENVIFSKKKPLQIIENKISDQESDKISDQESNIGSDQESDIGSDPESDEKGQLIIIKYRRKNYYLYDKDINKHVYEILDDNKIGNIIGSYENNIPSKKNKYKINIYKK